MVKKYKNGITIKTWNSYKAGGFWQQNLGRQLTVDGQRMEAVCMDFEAISQCFENYGAIAVFVIVMLEYLNLPGFPAGVIMPLAGVWAANGKLSFPFTMLVSVAGG